MVTAQVGRKKTGLSKRTLKPSGILLIEQKNPGMLADNMAPVPRTNRWFVLPDRQVVWSELRQLDSRNQKWQQEIANFRRSQRHRLSVTQICTNVLGIRVYSCDAWKYHLRNRQINSSLGITINYSVFTSIGIHSNFGSMTLPRPNPGWINCCDRLRNQIRSILITEAEPTGNLLLSWLLQINISGHFKNLSRRR